MSKGGASNRHPGGGSSGKKAGRLDVRPIFADEDPPSAELRDLPPAYEDGLFVVKGDRRLGSKEPRNGYMLVVSIFAERQAKRSQEKRDRVNISAEANAIARDPRFKDYLKDCERTGQKPISNTGMKRAITKSLQ